MTFGQFWTILIKRWKLIVICFLLVGAGSFIGSKLLKPVYQSSTLVQVVISSGSNNQASYDNLLASEQLVQTETTLATSDRVLREVASHYPGLSVSKLTGEVTSSSKTNTQLFEIDVVDANPDMAARLANDIAATLIKQQFQSMQQTTVHAQQQIQQNIDQTHQDIDDTTTKISALQVKGGSQGQIALLQAQLSGLQQHYSQWQIALAQLELSQAQTGNPLQISQPAQPVNSPVRPNISLNTAGGLLTGLLLGILLALLYEQLDTRVRTPEEITRLLEWPVLARIWRFKTSSPKDVINPTGNNVNVESFRILRTNIGFSSVGKRLHSMIVTSPLSGNGKSTIAANLAIFMAKAGKSTLLIDADLRHPTQHTLFDLSNAALGLTNAVLAFNMPNVPNTPPIQEYAADTSAKFRQSGPTQTHLSLKPFCHSVNIPNLWVMPSGPLPPNPSELLESHEMQSILEVIANSGIEVVIFDTSPLLGLSDTSILASKVDGALVVIDTTRATKNILRQMKVMLSQTGVKVLGCVANKLQHKHNSTYDYYNHVEEQDSRELFTRNGHMPSTPVTPVFVEPSNNSIQTTDLGVRR